ncbi:MAG: aminotransferase class I/II-fold pyridoxal phosphate-dependent enzyme [Alphaproteobacteria bacterium]|nr:aminotransferase class I/II-fold pyridoxal phosphate-dependent enzyme [Alphaproteobacteria bacterium]
MPHERLEDALRSELTALREAGTLKGQETVTVGVLPPQGGKGPRYLLAGEGGWPFLRMNSNSYLGMSRRPEVVAADETATRAYGAGPGAVRFISGTWAPHVELEQRLAAFHGRPAGMIFSSAYATVMGLLPSLISPDTAVISDELNHNCIINAIRLARPRERHVYRHLDLGELERALDTAKGACRRAIVVTDGIFSMRGDHAPLGQIMDIARRFDAVFDEGVLVVVDDSHGVGAFGATGRGTEEHTGSGPVDILVGTLGKAFGVNGGYVVASDTIIGYLREKAPFYIYSNPITPGEAAAAVAALAIVDGPDGRSLLDHLRAMTARLSSGIVALGLETIPGDHPIVPLMVRDTARTSRLVRHLRGHGVLATGLGYPVVPKGEEEIRFQVSAEHTAADIDEVLGVLADAP